MKKHVWADPTKEWQGFRLTAYSLDLEKYSALPITRRCVIEGKDEDEVSTTLGEVIKELADRKFEIEEDYLGRITVKMEAEELVFLKPLFPTALLRELVRFGKEDISPFDTVWFFYDSDSCRDDPHELYTFFVVYRDRIVRESVSFSDHSQSGFNPDVFRSRDKSDSIWVNDEAWQKAYDRYWYRRFYTETRTGQLMLLREDNPRLYNYESRPGPDTAVLLQSLLTQLKKVRFMLWAVIVLGIFMVFLFWK